MKRSILLIAFLLGLSPFIKAQNASAEQKMQALTEKARLNAAKWKTADGKDAQSPESIATQATDRLTQFLNLSPSQRTSVYASNLEFAKKSVELAKQAAASSDRSGDPLIKIKALAKESARKISQVLNPSQKAKYDQILNEEEKDSK